MERNGTALPFDVIFKTLFFGTSHLYAHLHTLWSSLLDSEKMSETCLRNSIPPLLFGVCHAKENTRGRVCPSVHDGNDQFRGHRIEVNLDILMKTKIPLPLVLSEHACEFSVRGETYFMKSC
jgi:hypothetical protein